MSCNGIRTRRFFPFIKCPSTGNALSRLSRLKVGCVYLINSRQNSFGRIINCIILSRQVYILRRIISPFVSNLIVCNRLRLECPSTFVGDGFSYYIIAVIGLDSWIFRPTAESPKTFLFSVICIGGRIAVECSIHRNCSFGLIRISVSRTSLVGRSESTPIIVNFINHGFLFPFCGQGDIFVGGLNCGPFFEEFVLIHPTQEFIILRGGFHLPNSVVT